MRKKLVPIFMLGLVFMIGWRTENDPATGSMEQNESQSLVTAFLYDSNCTRKVQDTFHQLGVTLSKEVCETVKIGHPDDFKG